MAFLNFNAIIDTGTTLILAPTGDAAIFYARVPGAVAANDGSGFYYYPLVFSILSSRLVGWY